VTWSSTPSFTGRKASLLSLYAACTPVASCTGQAWCAWQNGYKQVSGSNSEICGKLWFSEMNIVSGDWLLVFQATAILYFKRFYQKWSVMEHDPKHIMLTCIYLSCKVEEFHVSAEELGKGIQQDPQVVLKNELTVLQASVSLCAIVSFCCASCWVLDDIMTVPSCCFWECDKLRMQIPSLSHLIWLLSLGLEHIIISLSTPTVGMRLS
jgi:hypothetical protein